MLVLVDRPESVKFKAGRSRLVRSSELEFDDDRLWTSYCSIEPVDSFHVMLMFVGVVPVATRFVGAFGPTITLREPVMVGTTVSVAYTVWPPTVRRMTEKVCEPLSPRV